VGLQRRSGAEEECSCRRNGCKRGRACDRDGCRDALREGVRSKKSSGVFVVERHWCGSAPTLNDALVEEEVGPRAEDLVDRNLLDDRVGAVEPDARVPAGGRR